MNSLLISSRISGVKNLDKEVQINFAKKIFGDEALQESHVKTIYGSNGSGKSGIVHAYEFLSHLVSEEFIFKDPLFMPRFAKLVNFRTKRFFIENTFAMSFEDKMRRFKYGIAVRLEEDTSASIEEEYLIELNARLDDTKVVFHTKDGEFIKKEDDPIFLELSSQYLRQSTVIYGGIHKAKNVSGKLSDTLIAILSCYAFCAGMIVSFGSGDDKHESINAQTIFGNPNVTAPSTSFSFVASFSSTLWQMRGKRFAGITFNTEKTENEYRHLVARMSKFIQLLIPKLKDIQVSFKHDGALSYAELRFVYDGYDIDYEFESTGVKKLCSLFYALDQASRGRLVIIDEIDAGIHDVFLTALVEYFSLYCNCQVIMTTHHVGLMEVVKHISKSIDILTDDQEIVTWKKNGAYSPSSMYKKGFLQGVPFNLQPSVFSEIFASEGEKE